MGHRRAAARDPRPAVLGLRAGRGLRDGENTLHIASLGLEVLGVDVAPTALAIAREHAAARGLDASFEECDALRLDRLGRTFDTVLDVGLLHTFDREERDAYVASLGSVMRSGGVLHVLCFGDFGADRGLHPLSEADVRAAFAHGWHIVSLAPERVLTRFHPDGASAWLVRADRA